MDSPYGSNRWAFQVGAASIDRRVIAPLKSLVCEHEPSTLRGALPPRPVPSAAAHRRSADRWPDRRSASSQSAALREPGRLVGASPLLSADVCIAGPLYVGCEQPGMDESKHLELRSRPS